MKFFRDEQDAFSFLNEILCSIKKERKEKKKSIKMHMHLRSCRDSPVGRDNQFEKRYSTLLTLLQYV